MAEKNKPAVRPTKEAKANLSRRMAATRVKAPAPVTATREVHPQKGDVSIKLSLETSLTIDKAGQLRQLMMRSRHPLCRDIAEALDGALREHEALGRAERAGMTKAERRAADLAGRGA